MQPATRSLFECQHLPRRFSKKSRPAAPGPASSASATSVCRSPSSSARRVSTPPASTSMPARSRRSRKAARTFLTSPTADVKALRDAGKLDATTDFAVVARARHDQHLRADAAAQDEGPGHVLHRLGGRGDRQAPAPRACSIVPRVDDLSRHDRRGRAAAARSDGPQGRQGLLPRVLARARRSGQPDVPDPQRAEGRRRPDAGVRRSSPAPSTARRSRPSCRSARRASPRWSSCSRTRSAP